MWTLDLDRYCDKRCSLLVWVFEFWYPLQVSTFINPMKDGWGLAADGQILFGSDGTSTLYQIDPQTMLGLHHPSCYFYIWSLEASIASFLFLYS